MSTSLYEMNAELTLTSPGLPESGATQDGFTFPEFPESLSDKYKPKRVQDFLAAYPRNIMLSLLRRPKPDAFFFLGGSGLGKTEMALAFGNELPAHVYHIPSKDCDLAKVRWIKDRVQYVPGDILKPHVKAKMYLFIIDEAEVITRDAVNAFLSLLDATGKPKNAIFIFTGNMTPDDPTTRFMSRVKLVRFEKTGIERELVPLMANIWMKEGGTIANAPNFAQLVKSANGNIRDAINKLELELMALPQEKGGQ